MVERAVKFGRRLPRALMLAGWLALVASGAAGASSETERLALQGRAALEDAQFELAEKLFRQALDAVPAGSSAGTEARIGLARAAYGRKAPREMLEALPAQAAPRQGESAAAYRYYRALALYELGSFDEATAELDAPDSDAKAGALALDARRLRAWILFRQAKWPEADQAFAAWEAADLSDPVRGSNTVDWAGALMATGRHAQAAVVLKSLLDRNPAGPVQELARLGMARALAGQGQAEAAEKALEPLLDPSVPPVLRLEAWLTRAEWEEGRTNWGAACTFASNALALAVEPPGVRRARTALGRLLMRSGALKEGAELLRTVIAEDPSDPGAPVLQLAVARAFLDAGQAGEAEAHYRYYLESFTNAAGVIEALDGRAWALSGLSRFSEAADSFAKAAALAVDPARRSRLLYQAGDAYFANGQFLLASERYRTVLESPASPELAREARFQFAETEARLGRVKEAQDLFAQIEKEATGTELAGRAALRMAELQQDAGSLTAAKAAYDRFLSVYSNSSRRAVALYNRGLVSYQLYLFDSAYDDFASVVARFPESTHAENAAYMRVCAAFEWFNDERAQKLAEAFLASHTNSTWIPQVRFRQAEFEFNRAAYEAAERQFLAVADGYPRDPLAGEALFWAARAAGASRQFKRSIELDARLVREYPEHSKRSEAEFYQAEALGELGNYAGAIALLDEVIRRQPDSFLAFAAMGRRGDCQFTLGAEDPARFEDALKSYKEIAENLKAPFELRLQAAFKMGRSRQKMGRIDEAFEQYYTQVILPYLEARNAGTPMNESCTAWFTRAVFEAAAIQEGRGRWRQAVRLYQRVVDAGVAAAGDARRRIDDIQREHWRFF
jgi:tetratricopeptide (TPR) repeat protein